MTPQLYIVYEITGTEPPVSTTSMSEAKRYMAELLDGKWKAECIARDGDGSLRDFTTDMTENAASIWLTDDRDEYDLPAWVHGTDAIEDWQRDQRQREYEANLNRIHIRAERASL